MSTNILTIPLCAAFLMICLAGCYQAHSDDDLRTVPTTNNPHLVGQAGGSSVPAMGY